MISYQPPFFRAEVVNSMPYSLRKGIEELERNFLKMSSHLHSDQMFIPQIRKSIVALSEILDEIYEPTDNGLIIEQTKSIEDAINYLLTAIANRLQSSRFLYETKFFTSQNIGPFSEIYMFYEKLVDLFEDLVVLYNDRISDGGVKSKLELLIDFSVHSSVDASLFIPKTKNNDPKQRLIGITLNEHAFFQIKDTIMLLLHEIGHHIRPFNRKMRNETFFNIFVGYLAHTTYADFFKTFGFVKDSEVPSDQLPLSTELQVYVEKNIFSSAIHNLIIALLTTYFNSRKWKENSKSNSVILELLALHDYKEELDEFLASLSEELNELLLNQKPDYSSSEFFAILARTLEIKEFSRKKPGEPNSPDNQNIAEEAEGEEKEVTEDKTNGKRQKFNAFEHTVESANYPISQKGMFSERYEVKTPFSGKLVEKYLTGLSLMGINEDSEPNKIIFAEHILNLIKRAVDRCLVSHILDTLKLVVDEAQADNFFIRALNITKFETFRVLLEERMKKSQYLRKEKTNYFGARLAIVAKYFNDDRANEIDLADLNKAASETFNITQADLRNVIIEPISKYLSDKFDVFPEIEFFQLETDKPDINSLGAKIKILRNSYANLIENKIGFDEELSILKIFG